MTKYIYIGLKKIFVWGVFRIEEIQDKNNETGLKERGGIEMSIYSASIRDARSLRFQILTMSRWLEKVSMVCTSAMPLPSLILCTSTEAWSQSNS
jgi:hypothetical protein